tara:strand:- start:288 stop:674 length:387 start_codon:yes stop_codon:yes gene_type:complete
VGDTTKYTTSLELESRVSELEDQVVDYVVQIKHQRKLLEEEEKSKKVWMQRCFAETTACARFWIDTVLSEVGTRMSIDDINAWVHHRLEYDTNDTVRGGEVAVYYDAMVSDYVREEFKLEREREASNE